MEGAEFRTLAAFPREKARHHLAPSFRHSTGHAIHPCLEVKDGDRVSRSHPVALGLHAHRCCDISQRSSELLCTTTWAVRVRTPVCYFAWAPGFWAGEGWERFPPVWVQAPSARTVCFVWVEAGQWGAQITLWSDPRFTSLSALWATSSPRLELALNLVSGLSECSIDVAKPKTDSCTRREAPQLGGVTKPVPSPGLLDGCTCSRPCHKLTHYTPVARLGSLPFIGPWDQQLWASAASPG